MQIAQPKKDWTFLCYNPAETNTGHSATAHLLELEELGSDAHTDIVTLNYRKPWLLEMLKKPDPSLMGVNTYHLTRSPNPEAAPSWVPQEWQSVARFATATPDKIQSQPLDQLPRDADPADAATLKKFLLTNMKAYPARHFCLTMTAHGGGLAGQACIGGQHISNEDLGRVLKEVAQETGQKIDVLNLDTCYGANLEVLHPLRDAVGTVVASQGTTAMYTQPLAETVKAVQASLQAGQEVTGSQLGQLFVQEARFQDLSNFHTATLSAVDMAKVGQVSDAVARLHAHILDKNIDPALICQAMEKAEKLDYSSVPRHVSVWDLGSLGKQLAAACPEIREDALALQKSVQAAVLSEEHEEIGKETLLTRLLRAPLQNKFEDHPELTGISMHYDVESHTSGSRIPMLQDTELGKQTQIGKFFEHISTVYREHQAQLPAWKVKLDTLSGKSRVMQSKLNKAIGIPFGLQIAKWGLRVGATVAGSMALAHFGVPVAQAVAGPLLVASAARNIYTQVKTAANPEATRDARIEAVGNVALGGCLGAFGLSLMGILPAGLGWPLAGAALATHGAVLLAKHGADAPERKQYELQQDRFRAASTVAEKLAAV